MMRCAIVIEKAESGIREAIEFISKAFTRTPADSSPSSRVGYVDVSA